MNILVIGNGFDLAHGLPTKYGDFLNFVYFCNNEYMKNSTSEKFNPKIRKEVNEKITDDVKEKIKKYIHTKDNTTLNNFWIEHFFKRRNEIGENWIDFEQEIGDVLKKLEYQNSYFYWIFYEICKYYEFIKENDYNYIRLHNLKNISPTNRDSIVYLYNGNINISNKNENYILMWNDIYNEYIIKIKNKLIEDLDNLILAFEIYLKEVVQTIPVQYKDINIQSIGEINKVISFNYTNTFSNIYNNVEVNYLHGKVREDLSNETNNMVLGIDEYLPKETKSTNLTFVYFKKYFQRIYKKNGAKYKEWLTEPDIYMGNGQEGIDYYKDGKLNIAYNNVYFFGHSLAESDRDILRELIENEYTKIKIFYYNIESYGIQIQNLIKIIGQDKLLEYTYSENKKIEFIEQK